MRAADLVEPYPTVSLDSNAMDAVRLMADQHLVGVIVMDADNRPHSILPGSQLLCTAIPPYVLEDPSLARVVDERHADLMCTKLTDRTVRDVIPTRSLVPAATVSPDATALEIAALMAKSHTPLVAVVDHGTYIGAITASGLLRRLLAVPS